ncbi:MAG: glucoamylase family protein [Cyclobacteriaceae bacterium]
MKFSTLVILFASLLFTIACGNEPDKVVPTPDKMQLIKLRVGSEDILGKDVLVTELDKPMVITFSIGLDPTTAPPAIQLMSETGEPLSLTFAYLDNNSSVSIKPELSLAQNQEYTITITNEIKGEGGQIFDGYSQKFSTINESLEITKILINDLDVTDQSTRITKIDLNPTFQVSFSSTISEDLLENKVTLVGGGTIPLTYSQVNDSTVLFTPNAQLKGYQRNRLVFSSSIDVDEKVFDGYTLEFFTKVDSTLKFPEISDEELLTKIQQQTFKYFYDFGHPKSGLTKERNTSGDIVTMGGSGFGLMTMIVGIERGFITREQGIERLSKMINFLATDASRYHGVWPHWLNGNSGTTVPFGTNDDGGDLVETSFLIQGLLTVRQYLNAQNTEEAALIATINKMWEEVEWNWHVQPGTNSLTWHWSPNTGFALNLKVSGWNESLVTYLLAAASPTHSIEKNIYTQGWTRNGAMRNGNSFYDITLPLGESRGGPLFYAHYSFLGLNPTNLSDEYASCYFEQNRAHTLINRAYCIDNPRNYVGYTSTSWGLTASDNPSGYSAHSPTNDLGVITPTAAISSIPYTPEESMEAIRFFYYILGDRLWGEYGFYDAFNITENWYASSYLAIDQGPIVCMIENHRTGLLWDLFMSAPEVQAGLDKLGFSY